MALEKCPFCNGKQFINKIIGRKLKQIDCPKCMGTGQVFSKEKESSEIYKTWLCDCCKGKFKALQNFYRSPERCPYCGSTSEIKNLINQNN